MALRAAAAAAVPARWTVQYLNGANVASVNYDERAKKSGFSPALDWDTIVEDDPARRNTGVLVARDTFRRCVGDDASLRAWVTSDAPVLDAIHDQVKAVRKWARNCRLFCLAATEKGRGKEAMRLLLNAVHCLYVSDELLTVSERGGNIARRGLTPNDKSTVTKALNEAMKKPLTVNVEMAALEMDSLAVKLDGYARRQTVFADGWAACFAKFGFEDEREESDGEDEEDGDDGFEDEEEKEDEEEERKEQGKRSLKRRSATSSAPIPTKRRRGAFIEDESDEDEDKHDEATLMLDDGASSDSSKLEVPRGLLKAVRRGASQAVGKLVELKERVAPKSSVGPRFATPAEQEEFWVFWQQRRAGREFADPEEERAAFELLTFLGDRGTRGHGLRFYSDVFRGRAAVDAMLSRFAGVFGQDRERVRRILESLQRDGLFHNAVNRADWRFIDGSELYRFSDEIRAIEREFRDLQGVAADKAAFDAASNKNAPGPSRK